MFGGSQWDFKKAITLILCLQIGLPTSAFAVSPADEEREIDSLANNILHKEIDLERYYLQYRMHGMKEPPSRRWRFAASQLASAGTSLASTIWFTKISAANRRDPSQITNGEIRRATRVGILGILFDGAGVSLELGTNTWIALRNIMTKRSPGAAVEEVISRVSEIDALSAQRDALVEKFPDSDLASVYKTEGRVLKHFRDWCLSEFADVYVDVKSLQSSYNVYYALDLAADSLYLASYLLGMKALEDNQFNRPSAVTGIVGDCFGIASAPASSRGYYVLAKYWRHRLRNKFKETLKNTEDDAKVAMTALNKELASKDISILETSPAVQNRTAAYALWSSRYDKYLSETMEDLRHANKVALQGELSGPIISGSYLGQDVLLNVSLNSRYAERPKAVNNMAMAGAISSTGGNALNLALTSYWLYDDIKHRRKLKKKNSLPEQIFAKRMKTLDELDSMLISTSKPQRIQ